MTSFQTSFAGGKLSYDLTWVGPEMPYLVEAVIDARMAAIDHFVIDAKQKINDRLFPNGEISVLPMEQSDYTRLEQNETITVGDDNTGFLIDVTYTAPLGMDQQTMDFIDGLVLTPIIVKVTTLIRKLLATLFVGMHLVGMFSGDNEMVMLIG